MTVRTRAPAPVCMLGDASAFRRLTSQTRDHVAPPRMVRRPQSVPGGGRGRWGQMLSRPWGSESRSVVPPAAGVTVAAGYSAPEE